MSALQSRLRGTELDQLRAAVAALTLQVEELSAELVTVRSANDALAAEHAALVTRAETAEARVAELQLAVDGVRAALAGV